MEPDQITDAWLSGVLDADVRLTGTQRIGDGLVGMNLRLSLDSPAGSAVPSTMVAKLPSPDPTSRATGIALRNYEREVKFYGQIAPTVDIHVARCFHGEWDADSGDFILLLEDLSPGEQGNQITGCSTDHARTAVLELARLHGPRWGDATLDDIEFLSRTSTEGGPMLQSFWTMMLPGFFATYTKYLDTEGVELIERFGARIPDWIDGHELPGTVVHGDYRLDNLMFASERGGYPVAAVDWQTPGHGSASGDVSYFMGAGPLPEERRSIEHGFVEEYVAALEPYGVVVGLDEFWHHYARDAYAGVIMAVVASQVVGSSDRSEAMFAAMATRHVRHALDLHSEALI